MKSIVKKRKIDNNLVSTPYHSRLSWKIILPRVISKIMIALCTLYLYLLLLFFATVVLTLAIEKLIQDKATIDFILGFYYIFLFLCLLLLPCLLIFARKVMGEEKNEYSIQVCGIGKVVTIQKKDGPTLGTAIDVDKPYDKIVYKLVPRHNYSHVWNKFAEIADIFDPITYHLYDDRGNRVSDAILDRKSWNKPSLLKDVEGD